jgi:hypothetical protein
MSWLSDLVVRIKGDKTQLDSTLKGAEGSIQSFASKGSMLLKGLFTGAVITAIVGFGKAVIGASENLSDKFSFAIAGAKGALTEFLTMTSKADFSNFFKNIGDGFTKAKDLAEALDELRDKNAYVEYVTSGKKQESAKMEQIVKDKTGKYSLDARKAEAEKLKIIEKEIQTITEKAIDATFSLEKQGWENLNKMNADEAVKMYENIGRITEEERVKLKTGFDYAINLFGFKKGLEKTLSGKAGAGLLKGINKDTIESYGRYLQLMKDGEKDVIPKLFSMFQRAAEGKTTAQERFNGVLRITNALLEEQFKKISGPSTKGGFNIPQLGPTPGAADVLAGPPQGGTYKDPMQDAWVQSWQDAANEVASMLTDTLSHVFEDIGKGSFEGFGDDMLASLGMLLSRLGKMAIALGMTILTAKIAMKSWSIPGALALIAAGAAATAIGGAMQGAASRGMSGGGSGGGGSASMSQQNMKIEVVGKISGKDIVISSKRYLEDN